MTRTLPVISRSCGPCSACCTVLGVEEIEKPENVACSHLRGGRCGIYAERPESCRAFQCFWLMGITPVRLRPDKCGAMLTTNTRGIIVVHELRRGAARKGELGEWLGAQVAKGITVYVISGPDRGVWTRADGYQHVAAVTSHRGADGGTTVTVPVRAPKPARNGL